MLKADVMFLAVAVTVEDGTAPASPLSSREIK